MTRLPVSAAVRGTRRRLTAAGLGLALAAGLAAGAAPARADEDPGDVPPVPVQATVRMVQANIKTGMPVNRFQADVRTVLAQQPDFVTYNEVMFRRDAVLAPAGYSVFRSMTNRFTAETAVAWRADRWTPIAQGTTMISNWRGKPPGRVVELGRRFANWVTLQGVDGRVVSVVAAHTAPVVRGMPDLIRRSMTRLGALADRLAAAGPVLVGGDLNVHYRSSRYPADILEAHALVPTYQALDSTFPTGDHENATIDYVLERDDRAELAVTAHRPVELYSDHDAVVGDLTWQTDAPASTRIVTNDPAGTVGTQRVALRNLAKVVRRAPAGGTVELATQSLDAVAVVRPLKRALARGVHVRIVTAAPTATLREQRLARTIAARADADSSLLRCTGTCLQAWTAAGVPASLVLVADATGAWRTRVDSNRAVTWSMVDAPTQLRISTGAAALAEGVQLFDALR